LAQQGNFFEVLGTLLEVDLPLERATFDRELFGFAFLLLETLLLDRVGVQCTKVLSLEVGQGAGALLFQFFNACDGLILLSFLDVLGLALSLALSGLVGNSLSFLTSTLFSVL